jgi:hypothetical protein
MIRISSFGEFSAALFVIVGEEIKVLLNSNYAYRAMPLVKVRST